MTAADPFALDGVAIVTGASSGIGEHVSRLLAGRGMTVVAAARRVDRLEALASEIDRIVPCRCDVTSDDDLRAAIALAGKHGDLTVVVNNAGMSDAPAPALDEDPAAFR